MRDISRTHLRFRFGKPLICSALSPTSSDTGKDSPCGRRLAGVPLPRCSLGSPEARARASAASGASSGTARSGGVTGARESPAPRSPDRSSPATG
eukprot:2530436-Alexandrium_andersonii.AAC.1